MSRGEPHSPRDLFSRPWNNHSQIARLYHTAHSDVSELIQNKPSEQQKAHGVGAGQSAGRTQSQKLLTFLTARADLRIFVSFAFLQQIASTCQFTEKGEKNERHTIRRSPNYDLMYQLQSTEKVWITERLRQEEHVSQPCLGYIQGSYASQGKQKLNKMEMGQSPGLVFKGPWKRLHSPP